MSDLIDRQDLINGIYNDNPKDVLAYIAEFPTAEAKWTSVTGRLPKNFNYVLVTRENPYGEKEVTRARFTGARWIGCGKVTNVIAWMPLPEPYNRADMRGEEDEQTAKEKTT